MRRTLLVPFFISCFIILSSGQLSAELIHTVEYLSEGRDWLACTAVGDKVLFGKYGGTEVKVDDEELLVMREDDITAVIEG